MASLTRKAQPNTASLLTRLAVYDVLSHVRLGRWLVLPAPVALAGWVAADPLDRVGVAWTPGDLVGALLTTPLLVGLLLGLPILVLSVDLPLRQLFDGEAVLTFTRVGSRPLWWASKLVAVLAITIVGSVVSLAVVWAIGAFRSGSVSLLPTAALATLFEFDFPSTAGGRLSLVAASPILLALAIAPVAMIGATVGVVTRRLSLAGLAGAVVAMSAPFQGLVVTALPDVIGGLMPGASVLLPVAAVAQDLAFSGFLAGVVGWAAVSFVIGCRMLEDLR